MPLQICILETDVLYPELVSQYQGYGQMFERLFTSQSVAAEVTVYNVVKGSYPPDSEHYDAYLVTGSKAHSYADDPWIKILKDYLLERYACGDKLLGICFGHQLLALLLGGKVVGAEQGWGVGTHRYRLAHKPVWMTPALDELTLLISHKDQVIKLPTNATLLASSDFCPIAAYCINDQVLCFQGHPEFIHNYSRELLEIDQQQIEEETYRKGIDSLQLEHQGHAVGEWMMRFVAHNRLDLNKQAAI